MTAAPSECTPACRRPSWRAKAAAVGVPLSDLLRQAMARTRTWTAATADAERERTRQVARIGNNLNQLARWANRHASAVEAVEVIANFVAFECELRKFARIGGDGDAQLAAPRSSDRLSFRHGTGSAGKAAGYLVGERDAIDRELLLDDGPAPLGGA